MRSSNRQSPLDELNPAQRQAVLVTLRAREEGRGVDDAMLAEAGMTPIGFEMINETIAPETVERIVEWMRSRNE